MKKIGIICEYNPFHNGHLYHIQKIKELFPDSILICVMSGNFVQRGEVSILNKWDKTKLALTYGIDLVVELPYPFSTQSADLFCKGSIQILDALKVDTIVFGSECDDLMYLKKLAFLQTKGIYQELVKAILKEGKNYATATREAFEVFGCSKELGPNDTLGVGYLREIKKLKSKIEPVLIKRTNDYHSKEISGSMISATAIRNLLKEKKKVSDYIPYDISTYSLHFMEDYFSLLKYRILSETNLKQYQTVEEGIDHRIKKMILKANSYEELVSLLKTKRYTEHRIQRTLLHILVGFTKSEAKSMKEISYIRILGFNEKGKNYLKEIKKDCKYKILSKFEPNQMLDLEQRVSLIYDESLEHQKKPVQI